MDNETSSRSLRDRNIADYSDQWTRYTDNEGYYGSVELLADFMGPLISISEFKGARCGDIGSGTGRIVQMLLNAGAEHVVAVEPSDAYLTMQRNLAGSMDKVTLLRARGDEIPAGLGLDYIVSIGVVDHIPDPDAVIQAAYRALRPGGKLAVWLYGRADGSGRSMIRIIEGLRKLTPRLPHPALAALTHSLTTLSSVYAFTCRVAPFRLPLRDYLINVYGKLDYSKQYLVLYDQLRPTYAKYYTGDEARALLERSGFADVQVYDRHGYSWTVRGTRPQ